MEREFFCRVLLPGGTFKTTCANRLDDVNLALLPHLRGLGGGPLRIMDVAASSAISTLEWRELLQREGVVCQLVAGDQVFFASLLTISPHFAALVDRRRNIIHLDFLGRGLTPRTRDWREGLAATLRAVVRLAMLVDRGLAPLQGDVATAAEGRILRCEPVVLASRRVIEQGGITLVEDDLLAPNKPEFLGAFAVIRAANILNRDNFPAAVLTRLTATLRARLRPNGILVVCRTSAAGANHASIFQQDGAGGFRVLDRVGEGSEIEELVLASK